MKRKKLNKWDIAEWAIIVTTGIIGAYFFVAFILSVISLVNGFNS